MLWPMNLNRAGENSLAGVYHSHGFIRAEGKLKYALSPIYGKDSILLNLDKYGSPNHQFYLRPSFHPSHMGVKSLILPFPIGVCVLVPEDQVRCELCLEI